MEGQPESINQWKTNVFENAHLMQLLWHTFNYNQLIDSNLRIINMCLLRSLNQSFICFPFWIMVVIKYVTQKKVFSYPSIRGHIHCQIFSHHRGVCLSFAFSSYFGILARILSEFSLVYSYFDPSIVILLSHNTWLFFITFVINELNAKTTFLNSTRRRNNAPCSDSYEQIWKFVKSHI